MSGGALRISFLMNGRRKLPELNQARSKGRLRSAIAIAIAIASDLGRKRDGSSDGCL